MTFSRTTDGNEAEAVEIIKDNPDLSLSKLVAKNG